MGDIQRESSEESRIADCFHRLHELPPETAAIFMMYYKMSFELVRYRETLLELYGKRGISWSGAAVLYKRNDSGTDGSGYAISGLGTIVMDQIFKKDSR